MPDDVPLRLAFAVTVCGSDLVPCAVDAKVRDSGRTDGGVGAARPVPVRVIMVGDVGALDTIDTVPDDGPAAVGAKIRFSMQEAAGAILIGAPVLGAPPTMEPNPHQCVLAFPPVVSGKTPGLLCEMLFSVSVVVPLLVMVIVCTALDIPTAVFGKLVGPLIEIAGEPATKFTPGEISDILPVFGPVIAFATIVTGVPGTRPPMPNVPV